MSKKIVGQIGYCPNNKIPGIYNKNGGHYVYIRSVNGQSCDVNIITSLDDKTNQINIKKVIKVKRGYVYPIPINDANFSRWSGVDGTVMKNVNIQDIQDLGRRKIKRRHKFFIGKFFK